MLADEVTVHLDDDYEIIICCKECGEVVQMPTPGVTLDDLVGGVEDHEHRCSVAGA